MSKLGAVGETEAAAGVERIRVHLAGAAAAIPVDGRGPGSRGNPEGGLRPR